MTEPDTPARVTVVPRPAVTSHTEAQVPQSTKQLDDPEAHRAAIKATIAQLDLLDPAHVTEDGKPDATVLSDLLGRKVSAMERDDAWAEMKSNQNQARARKKE
jgi:hypothetical protein